jgi:hypothetical protein
MAAAPNLRPWRQTAGRQRVGCCPCPRAPFVRCQGPRVAGLFVVDEAERPLKATTRLAFPGSAGWEGALSSRLVAVMRRESGLSR